VTYLTDERVRQGRGSLPEIVEDGAKGFIVETVDQAVDAVARVGTLSCAEIRRRFDQRFATYPRMPLLD
jgi:hypothetical protein